MPGRELQKGLVTLGKLAKAESAPRKSGNWLLSAKMCNWAPRAVDLTQQALAVWHLLAIVSLCSGAASSRPADTAL